MTAFTPPRCPNTACARHADPTPGFYHRCGRYPTKCGTGPIQRYRCKTCRRYFSSQTFHGDYRDHLPEVNASVFRLLISCSGFRQTARTLGLSLRGVQHKFLKQARLLRKLNRNVLTQLPEGLTFVFDELETFEQSPILPLTVPVLVEKDSFLVVATGVADIRRVQKTGSARQRWLEQYEQQHGRRKDLSRACIRQVLERLGTLLEERKATVVTDLKSAYATAMRELFGDQVEHQRYSSKLPRTVRNPLFAVNLTEAMLRDNLGRLRRRTWLYTKRQLYLRLHLEMYAAYRNLVRLRTNGEKGGRTPAVALGLLPRRLSFEEALAWRQDWGPRSIRPGAAVRAGAVA